MSLILSRPKAVEKVNVTGKTCAAVPAAQANTSIRRRRPRDQGCLAAPLARLRP
jgi:hypothetical protein